MFEGLLSRFGGGDRTPALQQQIARDLEIARQVGVDPAEIMNHYRKYTGGQGGQGGQPIPTQGERMGRVRDLFAPRESAEPVDSRGLMRMGDLNASGQEPVTLTPGTEREVPAGMVESPRAQAPLFEPRGGAAEAMTAAGPEDAQPALYPRRSPIFTGAPMTAEAGPEADVSALPAFSGEGTRTVSRRPRLGEVLFDPKTPADRLADVAKYGPAFEAADRATRHADVAAKIDQELQGGGDPLDVLQRHLGKLAENPQDLKQVISSLHGLRTDATRAKTEARKLDESEQKHHRLQAARAEVDEQINQAMTDGDDEMVSRLRLAKHYETPEAVRQAAALGKLRMQEKGKGARLDTTEHGKDTRQAEALAAREREQVENRRTRLQILRLTHDNQKVLVNYREQARRGRPGTERTKDLTHFGYQLLNERKQITGQLERERKHFLAAQEIGRDGSEFEAAIETYERRILEIDAQHKKVKDEIHDSLAATKPEPGGGKPGAASKGGFDLNKYLKKPPETPPRDTEP